MKRYQNKTDTDTTAESDFLRETDELIDMFKNDNSTTIYEQSEDLTNSEFVNDNNSFNQPEGLNPIIRLGAVKNISRWALRNERGDLLYNDEGRGIYLPAGTRVVKLLSNPKNKNYIKILVWYEKKYIEGYIYKDALNSEASNEVLQKYGRELFLNDSWHVVTLIKKFNDELFQRFESFPNEYKKLKLDFQKFETLVNQTENCLTKIENGELKLTDEMLVDIQLSHQIENEKGDSVKTITKFLSIIFAFIDVTSPADKQKKISEDTFVFPITIDWFKKNELLNIFYQNELDPSIKNFLIGNSGEGINKAQDEFELFESQILLLKEYVINHQSAIPDSPEKQWLLNLNTTSIQNMNRIIFIHNETWEISPEKRWASFIPIDQQIGNIEDNNLFSVLLHELNVNTSGISVEETHIREPLEVYNKALEGKINDILSDPESTKSLFQMSPTLSFYYLVYYLDIIQKMNQK